MNNIITFLGIEFDSVFIEIIANIITSIGVFISSFALAFEFYKYIKHEKNKKQQYLIKSILKLIDIIHSQKNFIEYNLLPICILKSLQFYQLDDIGKIFLEDKYYTEENKIICRQLKTSSAKYVLPHKYASYQKRNRKMYSYISVDFQDYRWINSVENLYLNIQDLESNISKVIENYDSVGIFEFIKQCSKITENAEKEKICEINFELVIQKIQSSHSFKEISKQHTKLIEECDKIIEDLKSGIKFKTL